jgi:hypothetical protein
MKNCGQGTFPMNIIGTEKTGITCYRSDHSIRLHAIRITWTNHNLFDCFCELLPSKNVKRKGLLCTLQRENAENLKQIFPEKEYRGLSPNFHIHVSVRESYIPTMELPFAGGNNMWTDPGNI